MFSCFDQLLGISFHCVAAMKLIPRHNNHSFTQQQPETRQGSSGFSPHGAPDQGCSSRELARTLVPKVAHKYYIFRRIKGSVTAHGRYAHGSKLDEQVDGQKDLPTKCYFRETNITYFCSMCFLSLLAPSPVALVFILTWEFSGIP